MDGECKRADCGCPIDQPEEEQSSFMDSELESERCDGSSLIILQLQITLE